MTSEGLGEVFKGDSADMCAGKFPLVSMGGRADRQACADGERGPPSARAEITKLGQITTLKICMICTKLPNNLVQVFIEYHFPIFLGQEHKWIIHLQSPIQYSIVIAR